MDVWLKWLCHVFECHHNEDIIHKFINENRLLFTQDDFFPDVIPLKEIVDKCINEIWDYVKPVNYLEDHYINC